MRRWELRRWDELAGELALRPAVDDSGQITDALILLDLDGVPAEATGALGGLLEHRIAVVAGVASATVPPALLPLARLLDLTLAPADTDGDRSVVAVPDVAAATAVLVDAVAAAPRAAVVTTALLRQTELLPVAEGLTAEAAAYSTLLAGPEHRAWLARRGQPRSRDLARPRVQVTRDGDRVLVVLDRPERRGAFDARMRDELVDALTAVLADRTATVELSGTGSAFSSGGDLDEFGSTPDPATAWVIRTARHPGRLLHLLGPRASARVHGPCVGAGVELPAFAGTVTAAPDATFRLPELSMGLLPGAGGTVSLTGRLGRWRTAWLALSGTEIDVHTALRWGLIDAVG
jgi:enoyl-CoA hydratase/carnithine racemase